MKPGLYVATIDDRPGRVAYWNGSRYLDVESGLYFDNDLGVTDVHPLVVLDPESDDPKGLANALDAEFARRGWANGIPGDDVIDAVRNALRALADPKPAEPTGLGAVVRDQQGHIWLRSQTDKPAPWFSQSRGRVGEWFDFDVAEVLSEGWSE